MSTLEALVNECEASGVSRQVLLVCPDRLPLLLPDRTQQVRDALHPLTRHVRARRHDLPDRRVAVSWPGDNPALAGALAELAKLVPGCAGLARVYDLPRDGEVLLAELDAPGVRPIGRGMGMCVGVGVGVHGMDDQGGGDQGSEPLDDDTLEMFERALGQADLSRFVRRARVMRRTADGAELAWEKRYVDLAELAATLAPGHDPLADRSRLRRLCRSIDHRMLRMLSDPRELIGAAPFALNLNIGSLGGPEFDRFDAALPATLRGRVVLVFSLDDVLADPAWFADVRDDVRRRGHRVLLRGLTAELADAVALDRLVLDYVQLRWSPALGLRALRLGGARAVLAGVDGAVSLRWAEREGVDLFQGAPGSSAV